MPFLASFSGGLKAFPTAEGFGRFAKGGRGGAVLYVTNINDTGTGSLRAAINASGPRTVVFKVGGMVTLNSALNIRNPYITIAGQTALGGGIQLRINPTLDIPVMYIATYDVVQDRAE